MQLAVKIEPSIHAPVYERGTDARNHRVACPCGWAYSGTWREVRVRYNQHSIKNSPLKWHDANRIYEIDA